MKSLFAKILLWFWFALAITVVGSAFISALNVNQNDDEGSPGGAAGHAFSWKRRAPRTKSAAAPALQAFLDTLQRVYDARGVLTDENGRDLLTNEDRSDLIRHAPRRALYEIFRAAIPPWRAAPRTAATGSSSSCRGRTWAAWFLQPEHLFVMAAAVFFCYWLALYLTRPVRKLQKAVERFGRGDLSARAGASRQDELGELARTFDRMAGRIETLLTAERRLLLDISHELRSPLARLGGRDRTGALGRRSRCRPQPHTEGGRPPQFPGRPAAAGDARGRRSLVAASRSGPPGPAGAATGGRFRYRGRVPSAASCGTSTGEPVTVAGDAELLRRAVENVLRNAIRHAPPRDQRGSEAGTERTGAPS